MKFKIFLFFLLITSVISAKEYQNNLGEIHSRVILSRGEEQFRTNILSDKLDLAGHSTSNQYFEYMGKAFGDNGDDTDYSKTKSFLLGTNSNLVKYPDVFAGISLGHLKSTLKMNDSHNLIRSYGFNYLIGYRHNNIILLSKLGYTETKNNLSNYKYRSKNYMAGGEIGYSFSPDSTTVIYPYTGININQYTVKSHHNISSMNQKIFSSLIGINFIKVLNDKFMISTGLDWNFEYKERKYPIENHKQKDIGKNYGQFNFQLGYFIDHDFLMTLGYRNMFNKKYNYKLVSVGLSHYF